MRIPELGDWVVPLATLDNLSFVTFPVFDLYPYSFKLIALLGTRKNDNSRSKPPLNLNLDILIILILIIFARGTKNRAKFLIARPQTYQMFILIRKNHVQMAAQLHSLWLRSQ